MEGMKMQLAQIELKRIRFEVGYVYRIYDHYDEVKKKIEIKSINNVTRAIKCRVMSDTVRGDYDHVFTPQGLVDELNSETRFFLVGKMVSKKRLLFGTKRVLEVV